MRGRNCSPSWSCSASSGRPGELEKKEGCNLNISCAAKSLSTPNTHRAAAATAGTLDDTQSTPTPRGSSGLQLHLLERERLDAVTARDETDLARLRELAPNEEEAGAGALMDAAHLPTWLARLEDEILGHSNKEPVWGQLEPNAKRRRVSRFDSLSDAAIFRQRQQEQQEEEVEQQQEEQGKEDGSGEGGTKNGGQRKRKPAAAAKAAAAAAARDTKGSDDAPLVTAPPDAACVKCLVEGRLDEKVGTAEEEEEVVVVLCPGCSNPFHRACLVMGRKKCMFCEAEG